MDFLVKEFMTVVSIVCFLDVFVTFFTGEIDPTSRELVPKPFFRRWILPGLLMQLLVNPAIGSLSKGVFAVLKVIFDIGPVRVLRWCIAVVFPILYLIWKVVLKGFEKTELDQVLIEYQIARNKRRSSLVL